ncbi:MAG: hypothetical protein ACYTEQ_03090 [Planctomycetota bacterium]|jgi:hypothetical protein
MMKELSKRDRRVLKLGAVCAIAVLGLVFGAEWLGHWAAIGKSLGVKRAKVKALDMSEARRTGLRSIVPVFEIPQDEQKQKLLFREKFNNQLKKAGIESEALQFLPVGSRREGGYKSLRLQCRRGKCSFSQVLDLLAGLKENPYLVGVEEFEIKCSPEKRQEFELNITVSTFVK